MTSPKKPGVAFWATVVVVVLVLYVASFGPVCWLVSWIDIGDKILPVVYGPLIAILDLDESLRIWVLFDWYCGLGARNDWHWVGCGEWIGPPRYGLDSLD